MSAHLCSYFPRLKSTAPAGSPVAAAEIVAGIASGKWRVSVEAVRSAFKHGGKPESDPIKQTLPAFTLGGTFCTRSDEGLQQHSGLVPVDFDSLGEGLASAKAKLADDPHVAAVWVSVSGNGLWVLTRTDAKTKEEHAAAYKAASAYFARLGLEADPACKNVSRLCFVSYDPDATFRTNSRAIPTESTATTEHTTTTMPTVVTVPTVATVSHVGVDVVGRIRRVKAVEAALAENPEVYRIFNRFIEPVYVGAAGKRNHCMVQMMPFLHCALSDEHAIKVSMAWYELNSASFRASAEEHERETVAQLAGCETSFARDLPPDARQAYAALEDPREKAAFRICRDLALRDKATAPRFFLADNKLGQRVGLHCQQASRIMRTFCRLGFIKLVERGTQHSKEGGKGRASVYDWLLC